MTPPSPEQPLEFSPLSYGTSSDDEGTALAKHSSGVYALAETYGNLDGGQLGKGDIVLRKYRTDGSVAWAKHFGTSAEDHGNGIASDSNDNIYVVGSTYGSLAGPSQGDADGFLRKYSASGSLLWTKQFGTTSSETAESVATQGSNIYVVGTMVNSSGTHNYMFIRKFKSSGTQLWVKPYGPSGYLTASDVAVDSSGNAYVVGSDYSPVTQADIVLYKFSPSGTIVWQKQLDFSTSDYGEAVAVYGSSVYIAGTYRPNNSNVDVNVRVLKFSTSGAKQWDKQFGLAEYDFVTDLSATSQGVFFVGGTDTSFAGSNKGNYDGYVFSLDLNGTKRWSKTLGTSSRDGTNAVLYSSSGFYATGFTAGVLGSSNHGGYDAYLIRMDSTNGRIAWIDQ